MLPATRAFLAAATRGARSSSRTAAGAPIMLGRREESLPLALLSSSSESGSSMPEVASLALAIAFSTFSRAACGVVCGVVCVGGLVLQGGKDCCF